MKKVQLFLSALILTLFLNSTISNAQAFEKGTKLISLGVGIGDRYGAYSVVIPSIQGSFDIGITEKLGIGRIGLGGILAFSSSVDDNYNYKTNYTNFSMGVRGTYHFDLDIDKLDLYAGVMAGFNISNSNYSYYNGYNNPYKPKAYSGAIAGIFAGARYFFTPKFGVYGELGTAISLVSVGITFKF